MSLPPITTPVSRLLGFAVRIVQERDGRPVAAELVSGPARTASGWGSR